MNWKNVDLESGYERSQNILDPYDFDTLLLEISCNIRDLSKETIRDQFNKSLNSKIASAREVFNNNLDNIFSQALKEKANTID